MSKNMPYTKTIWVDDQAPAINASNLNKIEDQLALNTATIEYATSATTVKKTMATHTNNTTTNQVLTELTTPVEANKIYAIDCYVVFQSSATSNGLTVGVNSPSGSLNYVEISVTTESSASSQNVKKIFPNGSAPNNDGNITSSAVSDADFNFTSRISGRIVTGTNAGNVEVFFASETNGQTITIQPNSMLVLTRI